MALSPASPAPFNHLNSYTDAGVWTNDLYAIPCKEDPSRRLPPERAYASLEALCESALQERGLGTGWAKKRKQEILLSVPNRADLQSTITIENSSLQETLSSPTRETLTTLTLFKKNSPFHRQSYLDAQHIPVSMEHAITSGGDTTSPHVGNLRRTTTSDHRSIAYTGRVETRAKAIEQASFIFFSELSGRKKGIRQQAESGQEIYTLDYIVSSVLNADRLSGLKLPYLDQGAEREWLEQERQTLEALKTGGPVSLTHPETGVAYLVQCNPILLSDPLNAMIKLHDVLPDPLSGRSLHQSIEHEGLRALEELANTTLQRLADPAKEGVVRSLLSTLGRNIEHDAYPERKILIRDYLYKVLEIPVAYHCKVSTDRTGILLSLSTSLQQWIDLALPIPADMSLLLTDPRFKELFAANLMTGHYVTSYTRSFFGYRFSKGLFQNPVIQRLLPDRYLRRLSWQEKAIHYAAILPAHLGLITRLVIKVTCALGANLIRMLAFQERPSYGSIKHAIDEYRLSGIHRWVPENVIDETSPYVLDRRLLSHLPPPTELRAHNQTPSRPAYTPQELQQVLMRAKEQQGVMQAQRSRSSTPSLSEQFRQIHDPQSLTPQEEILDAMKQQTLQQLAKDIARISLENPHTTLLVHDQAYGIPEEHKDHTDLLGRQQAEEIYAKIKALISTEDGSLNATSIEQKTIWCVDQLQQGGFVPLIETLQERFVTEGFHLTTPHIWHVSLSYDPIEGIEIAHSMIMGLTHIDTLMQRQEDQAAYQLLNGLPEYTNPLHQGAGFVYASSKQSLAQDDYMIETRVV
ncbi:MAG: hypothetical protein WCG14_01420 [Chlamydiia bacterium]